MILISNHFFLEFDFDCMFVLVKIMFINGSGTHCSHLSRSRMSQLGSGILNILSSWDRLLARIDLWYGREGSGFNIGCIIGRQELLLGIALTEAGTDAEQGMRTFHHPDVSSPDGSSPGRFITRTVHHRTVHHRGRFINPFLVEHYICFAEIDPSSFQASLWGNCKLRLHVIPFMDCLTLIHTDWLID